MNRLEVFITPYKRSYALKSAKNQELKEKIYTLDRYEYDVSIYAWILPPAMLHKLILMYKGRKDIFFRFESDDLKNEFIANIEKNKEKEAARIAEAERILQEYAKNAEYKTWLEENAHTLTVPAGIKPAFKPYPHQLVGAYFLDRVRSGMMLLEMGLGKTLVAIMYAEMQGDKFKKVVVVTPNSLKYNFKNEVEKFTNSKAHVYEGVDTKKGKAAELQAIQDSKYIILNYEYFNAKPKPATKADAKPDKRYFNEKQRFDEIGIKVKDIDCVICDESHKLKNEDSQTYRNFVRTFKDKKSIVLLTGTPAPNRVEELYTTLNLIAPTVFQRKTDFLQHWCNMVPDIQGYGWVRNGAPHLKKINTDIQGFAYRKKKEEVLTDLPEKQRTTIFLEMLPADRKLYEEVEKGVARDIFKEAKKNNPDPMVILLRLRQFVAKLKAKYMQEIFNRMLEEGEKLVVFDAFKETLDVLFAVYKTNAVLHTGAEEDLFVRSKMVKNFQEADWCKMFFGSNQTCNAGLTLTASNKLFLMTLPYSVGEIDQLEDRIHRIGQKNFCNIYIPLIKDSIDISIFYLTERKRGEIMGAIDDEEYKVNYSRVLIDELVTKYTEKYGVLI